jgi:hypothetical protein
MKIKERLGKIKIRQRFVNLKERIKQRPLKYVIPMVSLVILGSSSISYAEDVCENPALKQPKTSSEKFIAFGDSLLGISVCLNPCSTPLEKVAACLKPCCLATFILGQCVQESSASAKAKAGAAACCAASWTAYAAVKALEVKNSKK